MEISFPFKKACVYYIRFQCHAYKNILKYNMLTWNQYTGLWIEVIQIIFWVKRILIMEHSWFSKMSTTTSFRNFDTFLTCLLLVYIS